MINARAVPRPPRNPANRPDPLDPGTYPARLVGVMITGLQDQGMFDNKSKGSALEMRLTYELVDEFLIDRETGEIMEDKPRWLSEKLPFHNLSQELAKSTKRYLALDPTEAYDGDWGALVGTPCMVTVVVDSWKDKKTGELRTREKISQVSSMRPKEAAKCPELVNPPLVFDFYDPDMEAWERIPDWLQVHMRNADDFSGSALEKALVGWKPSPKPQRATESPQDGDDEVAGTEVAEREEEAPAARSAPVRRSRQMAKADW